MDDREYEAKIAETKMVAPLLQGAIDMHYHGYPEMTLRVKARMNDEELLELAHTLGMRGIVIKSQMWPTMDRVYYLRQRFPYIECFASITLNSIVGGLSPWVVEAAAKQGAKVVWLPTWDAAHKKGQGVIIKFMKAWFPCMTFAPGLSCIDSSGKVTPDVQSIIKLAKDMDLVLCTGHISPIESLAIAGEAERIGFTQLVFTHPLGLVGATLEQIKEMTKRGAYAEFCALSIFAGNNLDRIPEVIAEIGASHCILSTDAFREWLPPGPEFLRMFLGRLLMVSRIDEESIKTMVQHNPAALLGLPPIPKQSETRSSG